MTPFLEDADCTLYHGDVLDVLKEMPDGSVDCVVTSPPYWGLRDYGTGAWEGGDEACDHVVYGGGPPESSTLAGTKQRGISDVTANPCPRCGARRVDAQLGLEPTPDAYVARMVAVFAEVRRVLASHGTCWINLGDSYAASRSYQVRDNKHTDVGNTMAAEVPEGLKVKDLVGIPWRVAFALQADGWWLRSDIVWAKPNPMPESVTDRPTKAHEYVFLLTKQPKYFFDQEAVREDSSESSLERAHLGDNGSSRPRDFAPEAWPASSRNPPRSYGGGRNVRSVWTIATQPYPEAHFATFPEELVRRCILAGCREGGTVLDPFVGSGTTCLVARNHERRSVGIDLNADYLELAARRLAQQSLLTEPAA